MNPTPLMTTYIVIELDTLRKVKRTIVYYRKAHPVRARIPPIQIHLR